MRGGSSPSAGTNPTNGAIMFSKYKPASEARVKYIVETPTTDGFPIYGLVERDYADREGFQTFKNFVAYRPSLEEAEALCKRLSEMPMWK